jgi:hypothetical protein
VWCKCALVQVDANVQFGTNKTGASKVLMFGYDGAHVQAYHLTSTELNKTPLDDAIVSRIAAKDFA